MLDYKFKLAPFKNMYLSLEEKEARFNACLEDTKNYFKTAIVTLDDDILSISVESEDQLSEGECLKSLKDILVNGSLSLSAQQLF